VLPNSDNFLGEGFTPIRSFFFECPMSGYTIHTSPRSLDKELATNQVPRFRAVIADDQEYWRLHLQQLLEPFFEIVAAAPDGRMALDAIEQYDPDLVVLDISMPELNGIEVAHEVARRGKRAKIFFVTLDDSEEMRAAATSAGAAAYLTKTHLNHNLLEEIRSFFSID
jgi:DNA-binding NarL/FixJ family response regulator